MGWKGLIYDPDLDGAGDIAEGLRAARRLLLECAAPGSAGRQRDPRPGDAAVLRRAAELGRYRRAHRGKPAAPADGIGPLARRWASRTPRTAASTSPSTPSTWRSRCTAFRASAWRARASGQHHRQPQWASGTARSARRAQPRRSSVAKAAQALASSGLAPRLLIDCSHGNSAKDYRRQPRGGGGSARHRWPAAARPSRGCCWKATSSKASRRSLNGREGLVYGQSVTDGCIGWEQTVGVLDALAAAVMQRRRALGT